MEVPLARLPPPLTAWICAVLVPLCPFAITAARGEELPSLRLEAKIPFGQVSGRIDHMAVDLARERLFVAELGNGTVGVVDLRAKRGLQRLKGFREPQGVGYVGSTDTLYVASGGDGSLRVAARSRSSIPRATASSPTSSCLLIPKASVSRVAGNASS
jgi:DNA-binding beta-propeller fold protein YncE